MLTLCTRILLITAICTLLSACVDSDKPAGPNAELFEYKFFAAMEGHLTPTSFSSDGRALYFTLADKKYKKSYVYSTKYHDGGLTEPRLAGFSTGENTSGANISDDGQSVLFVSPMPTGIGGEYNKWNIWTSTRANGVWAPATPLPPPVDSEKPECCGIWASDTEFYFASKRQDNWDIYRAELGDDGEYSVERMPDTLNTEYHEQPSSFDPETGLLLFHSVRPDGYGGWDIYTSKLEDGQWQPTTLLPEPLNTAAEDDTAVISPNGEWVYFSSNRPVIKDTLHYSMFRIKASILEQ